MKAAVYYGPGDIRVEDRPDPRPTDDNMVVQVHCCAICGTDLKLATVGNPRCHPPRVIGHEMVGHVVHAGKDTSGFVAGDRVTLATTVACGDCAMCALGLGNLCLNAKPISYDYDGAFAEYVTVPSSALRGGNVIHVPESVADESAALSEPLSCAINAQRLAGLKSGDVVVIIGGGPLGALHGALARASGARQVMVVQRSEPRLSLLRRLAGLCVIDGKTEDVESVVKERTDGLGADVVVNCAPSRDAHEQTVRLVRKGGRVSLFASLPKGDSEVTFDSRLLHYGEVRIVGASDSRPEHVAAAVGMMADGTIDVEGIVTHRVGLSEIHAGLELMRNKQSLKVLVEP